MHLFYSDSDWLATGKDIEHFLLRELAPGIVQQAHKLANFNHNDFLWGLRAPQEVYGPIVDEIWRSERHNPLEERPRAEAAHGARIKEAANKEVEKLPAAEEGFVLADQLLQQNSAYDGRKRRRRR
jgi:hypothetical protein